ncbi:hypothetical protein R950_002250 [Salmonella enterica subsp. enterica]|nr:hypothetical protein [Salmonella enterica subsp. enterica serovar Langford]
MNVACDGPSGRGPWMGRVIRSQHISNLKYEGYIMPFKFSPVVNLVCLIKKRELNDIFYSGY